MIRARPFVLACVLAACGRTGLGAGEDLVGGQGGPTDASGGPSEASPKDLDGAVMAPTDVARPGADAGAANDAASDAAGDAGDTSVPRPAWVWENPLPQGNDLYGAWATSAHDVWAVGGAGTTLHWDGSAWDIVPSGTRAILRAAWGSSASAVWAVGDEGTALLWNGSAWQSRSTGLPSTALRAVTGTAPDDVWAIGDSGAFHFDGSIWSASGPGAVTPDAHPPPVWNGVWAGASDDVWAVGFDPYDANGLLVHFDGSTWTPFAPPAVCAGCDSLIANAVYGFARNDVWAAGNEGVTIHWDGTAWALVTGPTPNVYSLHGIWGASTTDLWASGDYASFERWEGGAWTQWSPKPSPGTALGYRVVAGSAANDVWFFGQGSSSAHWDGTTFSTPDAPSKALSYSTPTAIWGASTDDVWAAPGGPNGMLYHRVRGVWSTVLPDFPFYQATGDVMAISGTAANDVWAGGSAGGFAHWDGSTWTPSAPSHGYGVVSGLWAAGSNEVWAVTWDGEILRFDGTQWAVAQYLGYGVTLLAVWGSAPDDVWVAGIGNLDGILAHYDGTSWTPLAGYSGPHITSLWGTARDDVWGGGDGLLHWDGQTWSPSPMPVLGSVSQVWASARDDAWAIVAPYGGDPGVVVHWDGSAWSLVDVGTTNRLQTVFGMGSHDLWVSGDPGAILHGGR